MTYDKYSTDDAVLRVTDQPKPKVGPGEVLVRVKAAAVNPVDWKLMSGAMDQVVEAQFPVIPGWDAAGVVEAVGIDVPEYQPGDEVWAYARKDVLHGGSFAEYVSVPVRCMGLKPASMDFDEAAGVPLAGLTALQCIDRTHVAAGDVVLVHNASGGVGQAAVQIAKALGATVIATASEANHEYLEGLGADHAVAYGDGLVDRVRAVAPDGVDVVLDFVGDVLDESLAVMREGARLASTVDPAVADKGGQWIWVRPSHDDLDRLRELVDQGSLRVEVAQAYDLADLPKAFTESRGGHVRGKLVVKP